MNFIQGEIIAIDKPYGMSSFGALAHIRYLLSHHLGQKVKIGHAGTLDPLATGVLVLCTGKCTKQIEQLQSHIKEYTATLQLGATTVSYDMEHEVNETFPTAHINRDAIEKALQQFVGDIEQLKPKNIHIEEIEVTDFDAEKMQVSIRVVCGKGTYIRALARDLGRALDSGAYLTALRRTRTGSFTVNDCIDYDHFQEWLDANVKPITPEESATTTGQNQSKI